LQKQKKRGNPCFFYLSQLVHAIALLKAIHASAGIYQLLTAGKERVALGANFNLELTLDGTALEGLTASATNDALTVIGVDILLHRVILLYLLGAGRLAALLLHAGIYNPNEVIISYTAVPVQVLF
jgi:hypothetical protein